MKSNLKFTIKKKKTLARVWRFTLFIVPLSTIADSRIQCLWKTKKAVHTPQNTEWSFRGQAKGQDWLEVFPVKM